ncbi:hypothetical protein HPB50_017597 [Hyalomma asiaticum]|uniref:Uncharacterized protein n=1 Tax=Hyalomma asiaticum TaxID=266040 RepID=A0ACB7TM82_HYAAI|nr:hypothetical protein HPB50_017597 [Hyalomma asiaticum]
MLVPSNETSTDSLDATLSIFFGVRVLESAFNISGPNTIVQLTQSDAAIFITNPSPYIVVLIRGECLGRVELLKDAQVLNAPDDTHSSPHVIFSQSRTRTGEVMIVQSAGPQRWRHFRPMEDRLLLSLGACSHCGIGPLLCRSACGGGIELLRQVASRRGSSSRPVCFPTKQTTPALAHAQSYLCNPTKCVVVVWGASDIRPSEMWRLQGSEIPPSASTKYLGVRLTTGADYLSAYEKDLRRRQREIGRLALGVHKHTPVEAVQGEIGWSSFMAREATAKIYEMNEADCGTTPAFRASTGVSGESVRGKEDKTGRGSTAKKARAGVLRTRLWRARFTEGIVATRAICGNADKTLRHVTLECGRVLPPAGTTALTTALGFRPEEGRNVWQAVETTKRRLAFWWQGGALRK